MSIEKIDIEWAEAQMDSTGYGRSDVATMRRLIKAVDASSIGGLDDLDRLLDDLSRFAKGQILESIPDRPNENWVDVRPGDYAKGDWMRVKPDAYAGGSARDHNGKRGRCLGTMGGNVVLGYEDGGAFNHSPDRVQKSA